MTEDSKSYRGSALAAMNHAAVKCSQYRQPSGAGSGPSETPSCSPRPQLSTQLFLQTHAFGLYEVTGQCWASCVGRTTRQPITHSLEPLQTGRIQPGDPNPNGGRGTWCLWWADPSSLEPCGSPQTQADPGHGCQHAPKGQASSPCAWTATAQQPTPPHRDVF